MIAQWRDCFQTHVASALDGPLVVLLQQQGADQTGDGILVGEDTDDLAAPLDLAVEGFESRLFTAAGLVECSLTRCWAGKPM